MHANIGYVTKSIRLYSNSYPVFSFTVNFILVYIVRTARSEMFNKYWELLTELQTLKNTLETKRVIL